MHFNYSTADVANMRRVAYWNDVVCKHLVPAEVRYPSRDAFFGSLSVHSVGNLMISRMSTVQHACERTAQHVRSSPDDDFVLALAHSGSGVMRQNDHEVVVRPGDVVLYDGARPFVHHIRPESSIVVRIPRTQLRSRFAQAEQMLSVRIAEGRTMAALLHGIAEEAFQLSSADAQGIPGARLAGALLDTLAAALETQMGSAMPRQAHRYSELYDKAQRHIEIHLDSQDLGTPSIASAIHVSPRTLTRVFAARDTTVMQEVWRRRLGTSFTLLKEGRVQGVSQAAYQCGFTDLTHFSRAFKRLYGATPSSVLYKRAPEHNRSD